jgi:hypothetical protein
MHIPVNVHWLFNFTITVDDLLLLDYDGHLDDLDVLFSFLSSLINTTCGLGEQWRGRWGHLPRTLDHFGSWRWCARRLHNARHLRGVVEAQWERYLSRHHGDVGHHWHDWRRDSRVVPWANRGGRWNVYRRLDPVSWQRMVRIFRP